MNSDIEDATTAAVAFIMDSIDTLPADHGRLEAFFNCVISAAIESVVIERNKHFAQSRN